MEQQANRIAKMHIKSGKVDAAAFFLLVKVLMNMAQEGTTDQFDRMLGDTIALGVDYMQKKDFQVNSFLLLRRIADCRRMEKLTMQQIGELKRDGKLNWTDYFGECQPPRLTTGCGADGMRKIRNGIYLLNDPGSITLAIHGKVADQFLAPAAVGYGKKNGEYLLFDAQESAVALNELKNIFEEVAALVISEDSLHASLHKNYLELQR